MDRLTQDAPFHLGEGGSKPVKLMNHTFQSREARYADITNGPVPFQLLSLNYFSSALTGPRSIPPADGGPGLSMLVVLPRNAGDLGALEKAITAEQLATWVGEMKPAKDAGFPAEIQTGRPL